MIPAPTPTAEETRANAAFDALMRALARPGTVQNLPDPGEASIIAALIDRECRVFCADPRLMPAILETGAEIAELTEADHVFAAAPRAVEELDGLAVGSDLYPDEGATLVLRVRLGEGVELALTGPGIETQAHLRVAGLPEGFWRFRAEAARYPAGFEIFLVDGASVAGIPRSTLVETR